MSDPSQNPIATGPLPLTNPSLRLLSNAVWLVFTLGPERQTVPVAIALFRGQYQVPWGEILAAAVVATAPVAAMVLVFQRRIVQGLTAGAVKG